MSFGDISRNNPLKQLVKPRTFIFSWQLLVLQVLFLGLLAITMDKPTGTLAGQVSLEQVGFNISSYDMHDNHAYALVNGPRGARESEKVERGAWVNKDGTFRIDNLPVGEYYLTVRAPGFSTQSVNSLFVEEGHPNKIAKPIELALLDPTVNIAAESRSFTSKEAPHFWINATGAAKATVKVYKKDLFTMMQTAMAKRCGYNFAADFGMFVDSANKVDFDPFAGMTPVATFDRKLEQNATDDAHAEFKFDKPLAIGDYFAVAEVEDPFGRNSASTVTWFCVSDIGLVVKHAPEKTIVRAVDLNTLKSVSGVKVKMMRKSGEEDFKAIAEGVTAGSAGLATFATADGPTESTSLAFVGQFGEMHAYGGFSDYRSDSDTHKTYFYTDRPVYRLGQTVCYKGIARLVNGNGLTNIGAGKQVTLTINDPENNELSTQTVTTNSQGTYHGLINIPAEGKTGGYQVQIGYPDGHTDYGSFEVAEYRKPEYQVEVTPLAERIVEGNKVKARVKASYYFGGPVANARVKWTAYNSSAYGLRYNLLGRPQYFDFFDGWDVSGGGDDEGASLYESSGSMKEQGFCVTDANGEAIIEYDTKPDEIDWNSAPLASSFADQRVKIEAEVTDISRLSVIGSGGLTEVPGDYFLDASPTSYVIKSGDKIGVDVKARDYEGKAVVGASLNVKMMRFPYDKVKGEPKPAVTVGEVNTTTGGGGSAHIDMNVADQMPSDSYRIIVTSKDKEGHVIGDVTSVWVTNGRDPFQFSLAEAEAEPLTIRLDKKVYKPGDTARAIISGPFNSKSGMDAIVAIEGLKLHDYKVVPLTSSAQLIEIPIKPEYAPNCFIDVSMVGAKRQFYTQAATILVSPADRFLAVDVKADKSKYKPGENVSYTVTAKDSTGKPVKGVEFSLGVVDESIYAIRAEAAENIQKFFYGQIPNWVTTICTFPEQYSGGPDKLEPRVRKDFRDTAAWLPELVTDDKGEAHAIIKLPDNLTTWRATVRGVNTMTYVGSATAKIMTTQDIIARLALPRFYSQGDQGFISAVVHNYTDKVQKVKLALSLGAKDGGASALTLGQMPQDVIDIAPDGAKRVDYPITASSIGNVKIKLVATCPTGGDALEKEIYVKPLGIPVNIVKGGCLTKDSEQTSIDMSLPAGASAAGPIARTLGLATSSIGPVLGNFDTLIAYPYGCTEQTMSRLVPSMVAVQLNRGLHIPLAKSDSDRFKGVYTKSMDKLTTYQHGDGGWGWWVNDDSKPYLTALVLEGLKDLKSCGFTVPEAMSSQGLTWTHNAIEALTRQLKDPKRVKDKWFESDVHTDLAYMLYASARWPNQPLKTRDAIKSAAREAAAESAAFAYLHNNLKTLNPEAVAYLSRALQLRGRKAEANTALSRLIELANKTDSTVDWDSTKQMVAKLGLEPYGYYSYRFTSEEVTALAMQSILEVAPDQTLLEKAKAWLMLQRGKDGWGSTKTTAAVFKALLAEELHAHEGQAAPGINSPEVVALQQIGQVFSPVSLMANDYAPQTVVPVKAGGNLSLDKQGAGRMYYAATTSYFQNLSGDAAPPPVPNYPQDLKIERSFYRLTSQKATSDGIIHVKAVPLTNGQIKAGETILMKVKVDSPRSMPYVMVEADLPSGAEVVQSQNENAAAEADNQDAIQGDWERPWWTHQDILDDKIVFFGSHMRAGKSEFTTLLRMELPGKVQVNPVYMEGMYTKAIRAFSQPLQDRLQITE